MQDLLNQPAFKMRKNCCGITAMGFHLQKVGGCRKTTFVGSVWFTIQVNFKLSFGDVLEVRVEDKLVTRLCQSEGD